MADQSEHLRQRLKGQEEFIEILARRMRKEPNENIIAVLESFMPEHIHMLRKHNRNKHFVCGLEVAYRSFCAEVSRES